MFRPIACGLLVGFVLAVETAASSAGSRQRLGPADAAAATQFTVNLRDDARPSDAENVAGYFRRFGMSVATRRRLLFVAGTYAQAAAAGRTTFERAALDGVSFVHATRPPAFPPEIGAQVLATTLGAGAPAGRAAKVRPAFTLLGRYGYTPANLATYYDASPLYSQAINGSGRHIALIACDSFSQSDIGAFETMMGLPANTPSIVPVDGGSSLTSPNTTLDLETLIGAAPGATITAYVAPSNQIGGLCSLGEVADLFAAVAADMPAAQYTAVSDEIGGTEDYYASTGSQSAMTATDNDIKTIANIGGSVFAASGSWGAGPPPSEQLQDGEFTVFFPASDPYSVAVGGTSAIPQSASNTTRSFELAWSGSGGGVSSQYAIPAFQKGVPGVASASMRNVPDVAFDADENTAVAYVFKGQENAAFGTGIGADAWSAYLALADEARAIDGKASLTKVATHLYAAAKSAGPFTSIAKGCNGYYCASTKRYDNVTGLGVPDVAKLVGNLRALP